MDTFIRSHVRALQRVPGAPAPKAAHCMVVKDVAPVSVAAHAGVAAGDLLVMLDGMPAARQGPQLHASRATKRAYIFHSSARQERIELAASGIEIGIALELTPDAIKLRYDPRRGDPSALRALWEAGDWEALESLSARTVEAAGRDHPALAFLGAALCETGRREEGMPLLEEYHGEFAPNWTMEFSAVARYYVALALLARGDKAQGNPLLESAYEHHPFPRIADAMQRHLGRRPSSTPQWVGRIFPDYELDALEGQGGHIALSRALSAMGPSQVFLVCLLATYRGNGPYNEFMGRYHNYATYFRPFVSGLHVVTMEPERDPEYAHYFENEDVVREAGLPFELLFDDGALTEAVRPGGSPFVLVLDRSRRVLCEGELPGVDLWKTLAAL
jgi:hypothetical protein